MTNESEITGHQAMFGATHVATQPALEPTTGSGRPARSMSAIFPNFTNPNFSNLDFEAKVLPDSIIIHQLTILGIKSIQLIHWLKWMNTQQKPNFEEHPKSHH